MPNDKIRNAENAKKSVKRYYIFAQIVVFFYAFPLFLVLFDDHLCRTTRPAYTEDWTIANLLYMRVHDACNFQFFIAILVAIFLVFLRKIVVFSLDKTLAEYREREKTLAARLREN